MRQPRRPIRQHKPAQYKSQNSSTTMNDHIPTHVLSPFCFPVGVPTEQYS